jgi:hypothetical protein
LMIANKPQDSFGKHSSACFEASIFQVMRLQKYQH